jgi:Pro-kumamolisin, activation domain/Bacterial Ig-like domain (group 3)
MRDRSIVFLTLVVIISLAAPILTPAQIVAPGTRIVQAVDEQNLTVLKGNVHPLARPEFDRGAAPASMLLERMLLVLKRSPEQEAALRTLLDQQQDKSSPNYHKWLTPEQFGQMFGPSDQDIQTITSWLGSHGLQVARVTKGREMIEFSGSEAQVEEAFHTQIHRFVVNGESHWANASDPEIPTALTPVVAGVFTLYDFRKQPQHVMTSQRFTATVRPGSLPQFTSSTGLHALGPADYATIYNINPLYTGGINGLGTTIAVVGRTNINVLDVSDFRSAFGLVANTPQIVLDGPDPGNLGGGEEAEAVLDSTWSGAVAPNASVKLVISASTDTTDGVDLSELYIVENNLGNVMTESFSACELFFTVSEAAGISGLAEQAAAQGITYLVSTGDSGSAGCDSPNASVATHPPAVNILASTPFNVAVGGTQFNDLLNPNTYWSSSNTPGTLGSALSYIPENVWNESCSSCAQPNLAAGGGGTSIFFARPPWQTGVTGIPGGTSRTLPDVSLTAAGHDPYLLCFHRSCLPDPQGGINLFGIAGTSASAPSFAGIMALVNQKTGSRQGQANYVLYRLAATENFAQCNGSNTSGLPANTCIFNDTTIGTNAVPGETVFASTVGYDEATGLGSVNVTNLANNWSSVTFTPSTTTLGLNPTTSIAHGSSVSVNISVAPTAGGGTPAGDVALLASTGANGQTAVDGFTLGAGGSVATSTRQLPGGTYNVTAHYTGDGTFGASDSAPVSVTVNPEASTAVVSVLTADQFGNPIPFASGPYGSFVYLRADVSGNSGQGTATGTVNFTDNSAPITGNPFSLNGEGNTATPNGIFTFAPGSHSIMAQYSGDASFNSITSAAVNFTITKATTSTTVSSSASNVPQGTNVTLTATAVTTSGGNAPTGTMTFFSGATQLGSPVPVSGVIIPGGGSAASASLMTMALPVGQDSITANYSGDANYSASTSPAIVVTVTTGSPDFTLGVNPQNVIVATPGASGMTTLTVTALNGFNGTVNFSPASCSGLPFGASCSFSPSSITGSGSTTLTIATTPPSAVNPAKNSARLLWWTATGGAAFGFVFLMGMPGRKRRWQTLLGLVLFASLTAFIGCGGGAGGAPRNAGTPIGSSAVTVTVTSGTTTHVIVLTLNVQ